MRDKRHTTTNKQQINNNNNNNNNTITLQVTLFDKNNKYKPISTLIQVPSIEEYKRDSTKYKVQALQKICNQRYLSGKELQDLGYTIIKVRNYTLWKEIQEEKKKKRLDKQKE